jgi:hypothetical protein
MEAEHPTVLPLLEDDISLWSFPEGYRLPCRLRNPSAHLFETRFPYGFLVALRFQVKPIEIAGDIFVNAHQGRPVTFLGYPKLNQVFCAKVIRHIDPV